MIAINNLTLADGRVTVRYDTEHKRYMLLKLEDMGTGRCEITLNPKELNAIIEVLTSAKSLFNLGVNDE